MSPIQSWWDWCTESFGHMFAGVTAPILLILAFVVLVVACKGGDDDSVPQPPRSDVAGICVGATPGAEAASDCAVTVAPAGVVVETATPAPPTPTPAPRAYVVQPGDALSLICANEAADMPLDACVAAIVQLSDLGGPDEITAGQTLRLPPSSPASPTTTAGASARRTPTPAPVAAEPTPTASTVLVPEPTATPYASLVAIGPADVTPADEEPTPLPGDAATPDEATPTAEEVEASEGKEYTVQGGDSLLGICVAEVPDMPEDECMEFVVLLNDLGGPDEIRAGEVLLLP